MSIWRRVIDGAARLTIDGPIGALVGAIAEKLRDSPGAATAPNERAAETGYDGRRAARPVAFTIAVIALGAKMAKADGVVTHDEIAAFHEVVRVPARERRNVRRVFDLARRDSRGFEPYARQVAAMFQAERAVLEELLHALFHIAKADGRVHRAELAYLRAVSDLFGLDADAFEAIRAIHLGPSERDPYRILGVSRDAGDDAIRAARRALVREHHPDRLIAQGLPQEFVDHANSRVAAINAAWDAVKAERGLA